MVLIGQSTSTTTIQLANNAPGFGDAINPKGMILPTSDAADGWAPSPGNGNAAYQNTIQDMTISTGTGNPGAIGVDYLCNNLGAIRNVVVQVPSGSTGVTGIAMTRQDMGPALLENVTVEGFAVGLDVENIQYSLTLDNVTLNNQTVAGLRNSQNQITANNLTATTAGPAIVTTTSDGEIVLSGAVLHRAKGYSGSMIPGPISDEDLEILCLNNDLFQFERTREGEIRMNPPAGGFTSDGNAEIISQLSHPPALLTRRE